MHISEVQHIVNGYLTIFPDEADKLQSLQDRLNVDEQFNHRKSFSGHGTGAAIVLSPDMLKVLLIHHKLLDKWMQPGGHWDPEDPHPWTVAEREAVEETGVDIDRQIATYKDDLSVPIDIDSHLIPENSKKQEPAHIHHDFRYVFVARSEQLTHQQDEVNDAVWVPLGSGDTRLAGIAKVIAKLRVLKIIA